MSTQNGKAVYITVSILAVIYAALLLVLYLFEGNIGGRLLYPAITSGVFCAFLIYMILMNSEITQRQAFSSLFVSGCYLIICLLICFPNQIIYDYALLYLVALPIAVFYGFRYAFVTISAVFVLMLFNGGYHPFFELQHAMYALIVCVLINAKRKNRQGFLTVLIALILQGILLLVSGKMNAYSTKQFIQETVIIAINSIVIPLIYRLSVLQEQSALLGEEAEELCDAVETNEMPHQDTVGVPKATHAVVIDYSRYPFELSYLVQKDCEVAKRFQENAPRAFLRASETADFARKMAYCFGANSDLVYAAALYHDIERIYKDAPSAQVILPEYLYNMIQRQIEKQAPQSMEELIVLLSNHVLTIHHYMQKNDSKISVEKVIENIFNLQLKKGHIISAGISMSQYHRMRNEFTQEFIRYLQSKEGKTE